jgi:arginase
LSRRLGVIGVPTSAAAFAPGQENGPSALRDAGLIAMLRGLGVDLSDHGDREVWRWRPDREHPHAQNVAAIVEIVQHTARRVADSVSREEVTVVLGGDCTVGIGTVAGHVSAGERVGLIYFDTHADLNIPASVQEGALDWMGVAHMLGEPGACPELVNAGPVVPLLDPDRVLLFSWGPDQATAHERDAIARRGLSVVPVDDVAADPAGTAARALALMDGRCDRLLVHFDVDVIDFTDAPLSENTGRNEGLAYDHALSALAVLLASPRFAGITITELNPDHAEEGAQSIERFARSLAAGLARTPNS